MKAHVVVDPHTSEPTTLPAHLTDDDWDAIADVVGPLDKLDIVSQMSLETAVFALQQIELHLDDLPQLSGRGPVQPDLTQHIEALHGAISRVRILAMSTLVTLGVMGDLPTGEDGKPEPVELPSLGIADQHDTLRRLTEERESGGE